MNSRRWPPLLAAATATGAHLAVGVLYAVAGLIAPSWAVAVLALVWLGLAVAGAVLAARQSWWVLAVPLVAALVWFVSISVGGAYLGWNA